MSVYQPTQVTTAPGVGAELRVMAVYALTGAMALILQTTVLHSLTGGRAIPDLILILCVYLGLHEHSVRGATASFLLGYLLDSFSGSVVGLNALAMTTVYMVVYLTARRLWMDNTFSRVTMVFLATFIKGAAIMIALAAYLSAARVSPAAVEILFAEALMAAALTPAVFTVLRWERRLVGAI